MEVIRLKTIEEFQEFYYKELTVDLKKIEEHRKKTQIYVVLASILGILLIAGVIYLALSDLNYSFLYDYGTLFIVISLVILPYLVICVLSKYVIDFKQKIINKIVSFIDSNLTYSPYEHISKANFTESKIYTSSVDNFSGKDYVSGTVGPTCIEFSIVNAVHRNGKNSSTIFNGLFFIADFNKQFKGRTVVVPDEAEKLLGRLGTALQSANFLRDDLIKLEDPEFEKLFVVYGTDQVTSRYVLSTSLMKRILNFSDKVGKLPSLSFVDSKVYIAVPLSEIFEPKVFSTMFDYHQIDDYFEYLQLAIGIVEELNLNTRIWGYGGDPVENN